MAHNYMFDEQKFYDICTYIIKNKDSSYSEIMRYLRKYYSISSKEILQSFYDRYKLESAEIINASKVVLTYQFNKQNGIIDKEIEDEFNKIGEIKNNSQLKEEGF